MISPKNKRISHTLLALLATASLVLIPTIVLAAGPNNFDAGIDKAGDAAVAGKIFTGTIITAIEESIKFLLGLVSVIAVAAIIYGGFLYITAFGDDHKVDTAKHVILYAVIGLIIIGAAAVITNAVINTFK